MFRLIRYKFFALQQFISKVSYKIGIALHSFDKIYHRKNAFILRFSGHFNSIYDIYAYTLTPYNAKGLKNVLSLKHIFLRKFDREY